MLPTYVIHSFFKELMSETCLNYLNIGGMMCVIIIGYNFFTPLPRVKVGLQSQRAFSAFACGLSISTVSVGW